MFTQSPASSSARWTVVKSGLDFKPQKLIVLAVMLSAVVACATGTTPPDGGDPGDTTAVPAGSTEEAGAESTSRPPTVSVNDAPVSTQPEAVCTCREDHYNCSDFSQPGAAQECFQYCLTETGTDVHLLDADGNRVVCETVWPGWATPGGAPRATYTPYRIATNAP
jgi:hypothetical protein